MSDSAAEILKRLQRPGILIRFDGSSEVFYIDEDALEAFKLPDCFQVGGQADPDLFQPAKGAEAARLMTGDELQRELNKGSLFRRTNLLNAFYCEDGPFIQGTDRGGDPKIELTPGVGKGHKPLTKFPSF